jgi:hypothetical protein
MPGLRAVVAKLERRSAWVAARLHPLAALPPRVRASLLQGAVAVLFLALGVVIDKEIAWVLIGVAVTVIVLVAVAGFLFGREGHGPVHPSEPPSLNSPEADQPVDETLTPQDDPMATRPLLSLKQLLTQGYQLESWVMSEAHTVGPQVDERLLRWARAAWDALLPEHPREAKEFFGDGAPYRSEHFATAYAIARAKHPLGYLRSRIDVLERVLDGRTEPSSPERTPAEPPEHVRALRERARVIRRDPVLRPLGYGLIDRMFAAHFPDAARQLREANGRLKAELETQRAFKQFVTASAVEHFPQADGWLSESLIQNTVWLFVTSGGDVPKVPLQARNDGTVLTWGDGIIARGGAQEKREGLRSWLENVARSEAATRLLEAEAEAQIARDALGETLTLIQQGQIWKADACPACGGV